MTQTPEVLDTPAAAAFLGVTECRMKLWRRTGGGPPFIPWGSRTVRYRVSDLHEWLAGQETARNTGEAVLLMRGAA